MTTNSLFTFGLMKKTAVFILVMVFVSACSIIGIHFKFHNPKRAGEYPEKTPALDLLGNQESKYRTCFEVTYYNLTVQFGKDLSKDKSITGRVQLNADAVRWCDTIQLDAHEQLTIKSVEGAATGKVDGLTSELIQLADLPYYRKEGALFVVFPQGVRPGQEMTIYIEYSGTPETAKRPPWRGGFVEKEDDKDQPWWGVACQSEGASSWWPCKDVVNDEPLKCDMNFIVPKGIVAVSNGQKTFEGVYPNDTSMSKFSWHVSYPINLYNITFYLGKFKLLHDEYKSKVTGEKLDLNHYVLEQHYDTAAKHFVQLHDHLAVYEELFGPYPFYRDGFKLVESPYAGMEHQTAIAYGNKFKNNQYGFDYIILHETAHEWWGNSLTGYDLAEGWLHEGFATYAECLYVEKTKGYNAYLQYLNFQRFTIINRRPVVGPYGLRYFNFRDGDIYNKGSWILHTLRTTINDDKVFFDIIKTFATRYMYRNVKSKNFIDMVNEKTGEDYNWFFDQYLYNRFTPELEYYKDDSVFYYRWNPEYTENHFELPVLVAGLNGAQPDTILPRVYWIHKKSCSGSEEPYLKNTLLVKFTENKKLRKEFKRQSSLRPGRTTS